MVNTARSTYHRIPIVCSAVSVQEELAEDFGQCTSSITGSHGILQYRYKRKVDSALPLMYFVMYVVCKLLSWLAEMSAKVKKHPPIPATKVARSSLQATRVV